MATGHGWTNEATHAFISIWGQSDVQSKLDSKNNHLLSLLLCAAIHFIASLYAHYYVPDEDDGRAQVQISCQPKSDAEELIHFGA